MLRHSLFTWYPLTLGTLSKDGRLAIDYQSTHVHQQQGCFLLFKINTGVWQSTGLSPKMSCLKEEKLLRRSKVS